MKCCKCKREARSKHQDYDWMCTRHYRILIAELRIQRKLNRKKR